METSEHACSTSSSDSPCSRRRKGLAPSPSPKGAAVGFDGKVDVERPGHLSTRMHAEHRRAGVDGGDAQPGCGDRSDGAAAGQVAAYDKPLRGISDVVT